MITIHNVFERWGLEDKSVQAIITSPPFWSLRKYDIPDVVIGGNPNPACEDSELGHEFGNKIQARGKSNWDTFADYKYSPGGCKQGTKNNYQVTHGNFCIHCQAWKGQYGLEPTYQLYIEHTRLWTKEAWRVLRDDGVFFLNLGDSYNGSGGCHKEHHKTKPESKGFQGEVSKKYGGIATNDKSLPSKCKILIPHRVAIQLIDDGWILRNDIVWFKPNSMPESCRDRFSKKFEYVFMFTKQPRYYFDLESVRDTFGDWHLTDKRFGKGRKSYDGKMKTSPFSQSGGNSYLDPRPEGKNPGDLWEINTQPSPFKHYAMFPEKLVERMILCSTKKGDTVCDCFAGSATTLAVAERLNRKGIGFDLGYEDIQKQRLTEIQKELI